MKQKAQEAAQQQQTEEENKEGDKKQKKKKGKELPTQILFGKGTRSFFDYLNTCFTESKGDNDVLKKKLDIF